MLLLVQNKATTPAPIFPMHSRNVLQQNLSGCALESFQERKQAGKKKSEPLSKKLLLFQFLLSLLNSYHTFNMKMCHVVHVVELTNGFIISSFSRQVM